MSKIPDIFNISSNDLGNSDIGIDRLGIDQLFSTANSGTSHRCIVCTNIPHYKMVPRHRKVATAEIADRGYVCQHCVRIQAINPNDFNLKELN